MFSTADFKALGDDVVPFAHITTHITGHKDDDLLTRMGGRGFPTLLILDSKGELLARPAARTVEGIRAAAQEGQALVGPPGAKGEGDPRVAAEAFLRQFALTPVLDPDAWLPRYIGHRPALSAEERHKVEGKLVVGELVKYWEIAFTEELGSAKGLDAVARLYAAKDKLGGKLPEGALGNRVVLTLMRYAEHKRDPILFAKLLEDLRHVRRSVRGPSGFLEKQEARLQKLWGKANGV